MKILFYMFVSIIALPSQELLAGGDSLPPRDPLARIDYLDAFNQEAIHRKFMPIMISTQCSRNVHKKELNGVEMKARSTKGLSRSSYYQFDPSDGRDDHEESPDLILNSLQWQEYEEACLQQLRRARRWAIIEPAREALSTLLLISGFTGITLVILGTESYGGSISVAASLFNSVWLFRETIRSAYNLCSHSPHPLDALEERFALNQCFIPRSLWPGFIKNFMLARQNPFLQQQSMDFIEFSLGLTTYRPNAKLTIAEGDIDEIFRKLSDRMDTFFRSYEPVEEEQYHMLRMNVFKFIFALLGKDKSPRYLSFHGAGGIGKTFFIRQLCEWIEKVIPDSVHFENFTVTSSEELEGTPAKPGVFLRVLRNQCLARKRGSVVLMDEAVWLNKEDMVSAAKRVFNGELAQLSTNYFGTGIDGTGVHLDMPPALVIVSANEQIKDDALRSRFDPIKFPKPTTAALILHGKQLFKENTFVKRKPQSPSKKGWGVFATASDALPERKDRADPSVDSGFLDDRLRSCTNFREIEAVVPSLVSVWCGKVLRS